MWKVIANNKVFNTIDLYFSGAMSKEDALGRLAYEHPNHQLCILNQDVLLHHLHFVGAPSPCPSNGILNQKRPFFCPERTGDFPKSKLYFFQKMPKS